MKNHKTNQQPTGLFYVSLLLTLFAEHIYPRPFTILQRYHARTWLMVTHPQDYSLGRQEKQKEQYSRLLLSNLNVACRCASKHNDLGTTVLALLSPHANIILFLKFRAKVLEPLGRLLLSRRQHAHHLHLSSCGAINKPCYLINCLGNYEAKEL